MKSDSIFTRYLIGFCVTTTGVCLLELILGSLMLPEQRFGFGAFLMPPLFGFLTTMTALVLESRRELSAAETAVRMVLQLLLIEGIVFGINLWAGNRYSAPEAVLLAVGIAAVYAFAHLVLWLNERRIARAFNERLAEFQRENSRSKDE